MVLVGVAVLVAMWIRGGARPVTLEETRRPTGSTLPPTPAVLRPQQGVYLYRGGGTDRLDKPPMEQAEGPQMPATVAHRPDGCWTFRIDYSTNHWQTWIYCPRSDGGLDEKGGQSYQRWELGAFSIESTSDFDCADAVTIRSHQQPGDSWNQTCTGRSTSTDGTAVSSGPLTFVGSEQLSIGGEEVDAFHYRRERSMTGAQEGDERAEVWFAADTGMPLRNDRTIQASTSTVIGRVTYSEVANFELTSTTPAR